MIHKLSGIEKIYGKEEGREGVSRFSVELFMSPASKKFVGGSFSPSFISFRLSENVKCKRGG